MIDPTDGGGPREGSGDAAGAGGAARPRADAARDPVPRARESARWLLGIAFLGVLAAGVIGAAVLLWRSVDLDAMLRDGEGDTEAAAVRDAGVAPDAPATVSGGDFRVALLASPASEGFLPDSAGGYPRQERHWRRLADSLGATVTTISGADAVAALDRRTAVVVPVAPCLAFGTGMALFRHLEDGGGLVLEGPVATRDEACEWRGWSVVRSLTGADDVRELGARQSLYLTVPSGLPISHGLPPGARVELGHDLQIALATGQPGAYWSDFGLSPAPVGGAEGGGAAATAALARTVRGGGRMAWFGFLASDAVGETSRRRLRRLHENALLWAARRPLAGIAAWPGARRAALLVTEDVEAEAQNARALAAELERRGIPGTYFVVSRMVEGSPEIARAVTAAGEVGTHTVDHGTLAGLAAEDQRVRLRSSRRTAEAWSGRTVRGLRPPEERYDSITLAAWAEAGGAYVAAENQGRSAAPELHRVGGSARPMVVVPRVIKDDYNVLVNDGLSWERGLPRLMAGFRKVRRLGGVAMLNLHTQFVDMGRAADVVAALDSVSAGSGWWTTTAGDVAAWWRARHRAGVGLRRAGDGLEVVLRAPADTLLRGATVDVTPAGPPGAWEVVSGDAGLRFARTATRLRVVVDSVAAGDSVVFRLRRTGSGGADAGGGELSRPRRPGGS